MIFSGDLASIAKKPYSFVIFWGLGVRALSLPLDPPMVGPLLSEVVLSGISMFTITVVPTKSDSEVMICLQIYQGLIIDRSLVY